jgi:hypothetical protein
VIGAAAQEGESVPAPVGNPEAEHVGVEGHDSLHVADTIGNVAELERHDAGRPAVLLGKSVVGKNVDSRAFGIVERDRLCDPGGNVALPFGLDSIIFPAVRLNPRKASPN